MAEKKFSKGEAIRFGWETMKSNFWFFVGLFLFVLVIYFPLSLLQEAMKEKAPLLAGMTAFLSWILEILFGMGFLRIALRFCDNEKGKFSDLFACFPLFFKYCFGMILYGLIVLGGLILLIIPGILWAIQFQFFSYLVIEGSGPVAALKKSAAITKGARWQLFLFGLLLGVINLLGALCLLVGLLATLPTSMVAAAHVYRKLLAETDMGPRAETPPMGSA